MCSLPTSTLFHLYITTRVHFSTCTLPHVFSAQLSSIPQVRTTPRHAPLTDPPNPPAITNPAGAKADPSSATTGRVYPNSASCCHDNVKSSSLVASFLRTVARAREGGRSVDNGLAVDPPTSAAATPTLPLSTWGLEGLWVPENKIALGQVCFR